MTKKGSSTKLTHSGTTWVLHPHIQKPLWMNLNSQIKRTTSGKEVHEYSMAQNPWDKEIRVSFASEDALILWEMPITIWISACVVWA